MVRRVLSFGPTTYRVESLLSFARPNLALVRSIPLYTTRFSYGDLLRGTDNADDGVFVVQEIAGHGGYSCYALLLDPAIDDTLLDAVCKRLRTMNAVYEAERVHKATILKVASLPADTARVEEFLATGNHDTWLFSRLHESPGFVDYEPRDEDRAVGA